MRRGHKKNRVIFWSALVTLSVVALLAFTLSLADDGIDSNVSVFGLGSGYSSDGGGGGSVPSGGGGGAVIVVPPSPDEGVHTQPPALAPGVVSEDITGNIDANGVVTQSVTITFSDGDAEIMVPAGTTARDFDGNALAELTYQKASPVPIPSGMSVLVAANFGPSGATFDPPITVTMTYDPATLPNGVAEEKLVLAYYDTVTSRWVNLTDIVVDTVNHSVSGPASHFTKFAVMAANEAVIEPAVEPVPPAIPDETPMIEAAVEPTPEPVSDEFQPLTRKSDQDEGGISYWLIIISVIAVFVIGLGAYLIRRQKA